MFRDSFSNPQRPAPDRRPRAGREDEDWLIDLAIPGATPAGYEMYRSAIRREYAFVPEEAFVAGRGKILRKFLAGPIFATEGFSPLERQARANLENELAALAAGK